MAAPFDARRELEHDGSTLEYIALDALDEAGIPTDRLPYTIRILLEGALRSCDGFPGHRGGRPAHRGMDAGWYEERSRSCPAVSSCRTSQASLRSWTSPPLAPWWLLVATPSVSHWVPVDLVIDHSVQVDHSGTDSGLGSQPRHRIPPQPRTVHLPEMGPATPDFLRCPTEQGHRPPGQSGMDRHGGSSKDRGSGSQSTGRDRQPYDDGQRVEVLRWGVGGIEAEAVMLGQPIYMLAPDVVGFELTGALPASVTATDMTLRIR